MEIIKKEKAVLIDVELKHKNIYEQSPLEELARLADTAGAEVIFEITQQRDLPDPKYFIGSGKAKEIASLCKDEKIDIVIFNNDLSGVQQRNLEEIIDTKIIDRPRLILDIFRQRARTKEGKLQVELAQLSYLLPRLTGKGIFLSRQIGGIGFRGGPGEKKLEVDRRRIKDRITILNKEINKIREHRILQRKRRKDTTLPVMALVGYTNSGKSTLLNTLTDAGVLVEDKLFATLDPIIRRVTLPNNQQVLFTDTVGFIRQLPHHIIAAFRATLEEVTEADILLHIIDVSNRDSETQIKNVYKVLEQLKADKKPTIDVFNKIDSVEDKWLINRHIKNSHNGIAISALRKTGINELLNKIVNLLSIQRTIVNLSFPYSQQKLISLVFEKGKVLNSKYTQKQIHLQAEIDNKTAQQLKKFSRKNPFKF